MSKIDYADMPASVEKHSPAPQPTTLENPAVADGQKPEAGSCRDKSTQAVFTNNDAPCNGVAPSGEETSAVDELADNCSSDDPVTRCTDDPISEADELLQYIQQKHGPSFDRQWLADTRARGYEPLHPGDPSHAHTYHGSVPVRVACG